MKTRETLNPLPTSYRMGLIEKGIENGEEIDPEYWLVLWHWERPLLRRRHVWVRVDAKRVGYSRNRSVEAAIRGVWVGQLTSQKKLESLKQRLFG